MDIKRSIHGNKNLAVATAEEDLSYALYVLEYSSGNFQSARDHICKSIDILRSLLPKDHLLLSSARRVKALILEEIALDNFPIADNTTGKLRKKLLDSPLVTRLKENIFILEYQNLLIEAEELHQSALKITIDAFGEVNVQTAKHYGNLGRLYQSMAKYQVRNFPNSFIYIRGVCLSSCEYLVLLKL